MKLTTEQKTIIALLDSIFETNTEITKEEILFKFKRAYQNESEQDLQEQAEQINSLLNYSQYIKRIESNSEQKKPAVEVMKMLGIFD
ncbi:hypothetical protein ACTS93_18185 [Empedobacter falsenii]